MENFFFLQKNWLKALPRSDFWDGFFRFCNYFDTIYFLLVLIPLIWFGISRKWGIRLFYLLALSGFINLICKAFCNLPRPCTGDPEFALISPPHPAGFPSAAAQTSFFLGCMLMRSIPSLQGVGIAILYILTISFSRLYLKVHYPIDILGGWLLGFLGFILYCKKEDSLDQFLEKKTPLFLLGWGIVLPLGLFFLYFHPANHQIMLGTLGITTGLILAPKDPFWEPSWSKGILAVLLVFFFAFGLKFLAVPLYWASFLLGFWIAGITPFLLPKKAFSFKKS